MTVKTKIITGVVFAIAVIGLGYFTYVAKPGDSLYGLRSYISPDYVYVKDISAEVTALEADLEVIDTEVKRGTMTPEKATLAKAQIIARIDKIQSSVSVSGGAKLTPQMRATLSEALSRLANVLTTYKDSLVKVETMANLDTTAKAKSSNKGNSKSKASANKDLTLLLTETVESLDEFIDEAEIVAEDSEEDGELSEEDIDNRNEINPEYWEVPEGGEEIDESDGGDVAVEASSSVEIETDEAKGEEE